MVCSTDNGAFFIQIVHINDKYISELIKSFPHVMMSKKSYRKHTRKYIGVVLTVGRFNYYVPFSSPKKNDYTSDGKIKSDNLFNAKMTEYKNNTYILLGTLKFNNMIPVPLIFVEPYNIEKENDLHYKNIILSELKWINKNQSYICEKAVKIYEFKAKEYLNVNKFNIKRYQSVLPFKSIENYINTHY